MDAFEDTHLALAAYLRSEGPSDLGLKYLWLYGALQALYLQQDSFLGIAEALGRPFKPDDLPDEVKIVRKCRNDLIGHPVERTKGPEGTKGSSHSLIQSDLQSHFVRAVRYFRNEVNVEYLEFDLTRLIPLQETSLTQQLAGWLKEDMAK